MSARRATFRWNTLWTDRAGRFSALKAAALAGLLAPAVVLGWNYAANDLGPRRSHEAILVLGLWTVRFLLISLAITPAARVFDFPKLTPLRRMAGVATALFVLAHLFLYIVDQNWNVGFVASEIIRRFYLTIGFAALLGLCALAITSTDGWMRRLRQRWKKLHRLAYPIGVLALLHFYLQSKADVSEPVMMTGFFLWLMLWRVLPARAQRSLWALPVLAVLAACGAAAAEFAWFGLMTGINPWRVLAANLDTDFGYSSAVWVGIVGLGVAAAAAARRLGGWLLARRRVAVG